MRSRGRRYCGRNTVGRLRRNAVAKARRDIAARGLVTTVVQNYYALITAQRHLENARRSVEEARRFLDITQKQERGGEVARADVIKARLQLQQRERDLLDAQANVEKARVALGVILFPNIDQQFTVDGRSGRVADSAADLRISRAGCCPRVPISPLLNPE